MGSSPTRGDPRLPRLASHVTQDFTLRQELDQLRADVTLRSLAEIGPRSPQFTYSIRRLTKFAYLLRLYELQRSPRERRSRPEYLPEVATAFEDLARLSSSDTAQRIELLAQASTMWSLGGYQANSVVLARDVRRLTEGDQRLPARFVRLAAVIIERNPNNIALRAQTELEQMSGIELQILDGGDNDSTLSDAVLLAAHGLMAQGALHAVTFWRTGSHESARTAIALVEKASELCSDAGIVDASLLSGNVAMVLSDSFSLSLWRRIRGNVENWNGIWRRHVARLAMRAPNVVELWPAQLRAVESGFLRPKHLTAVVKMPTSAGKTRLAELAILSAVSEDPGASLAAYIVPTRALAGEIERRLNESLGRDGIRVSALFGGYDHADYEAMILSGVDVLVATPEKLDMILRRQPDIADRLRLTILDEAHLIDDEIRGASCEILIARLRRKAPHARIILLSAVMSNSNEIGEWLDPEGSGRNVLEDDWNPSRLAFGTFSWTGSNVEGQTGTIRYHQPQEFFIPYVLQRHRLTKKLYPRNLSETTAELALHFQLLGPVLVGVSTKRSAEGVARNLASAVQRHAKAGNALVIEADDDKQIAREHLAELVQRTVGNDHDLARYIRIGLAYHHADLPSAVRTGIEDAYRTGALRILCATSTLSQGVNLPARTVLVGNVMRGKDEQITVREFKNLAGRAGRAFVETEGHVIIVSERPQRAERLANHYIHGSLPEPVEGELFRLVLKLIELRGQSLSFDTDGEEIAARDLSAISRLDSQLLALMMEELVGTDDELELSMMIQQTLCAVQLAKRGIAIELADEVLKNRLAAVCARIPDTRFRQTFYRTGLRISSCEFLFSELSALVAEDPSLFIDEEHVLNLLERLCRIGVRVEEFQDSSYSGMPEDAMAAVSVAWITGDSIDRIFESVAGTAGINNQMQMSSCIETAVARDLAWIVSASVEVMALCFDEGWEASPTIAALPAMMRFGVNSLGATYASSLGVSSRSAAIRLGDEFANRGAGTFQDFVQWLSSMGRFGLEQFAGPAEVHQILDRVATFTATSQCLQFLASDGQTPISTALRGVQFHRITGINVGDALTLGATPDSESSYSNVVARLATGTAIGYVPTSIARYVEAILEGDMVLEAVVEHIVRDHFQSQLMVQIRRA